MRKTYERKFDWDEARRRRATGESWNAIAAALKVSSSAVRRAVDAEVRERTIARASEWQRQGLCVECGGHCTRGAKRCRNCNRMDDLTGQTFSNLTVLSFSGMRKRRSHWKCKCKCGREVFVDGSKLKNGHTRSCGCIRKGQPQPWRRLEYGEAIKNRIIWQYRANAKAKEMLFLLTKEDATGLFAQNCHYCGRPPSTTVSRKNHWGEFTYNGIDRLDNNHGYELGNVVSCCMECNFKKGAQPLADFLSWVRSVAIHQGWVTE